MQCWNRDCVILEYQNPPLPCISLSRAEKACFCTLDLFCGFQLVTPSVNCLNSFFPLTATTEGNTEALHQCFGWLVGWLLACLLAFQLTINKWYLLYIFWFAVSIVLLEISVDVLLVYHLVSQKDDILFPRRVKSALFSAHNPPANTPTAICIGQ